MNSRRISNLLSFIVLGIVATALVVRYLLINVFHVEGNYTYWFDQAAYWLTAFATLFSAFTYAQSRRNGWFMILLFIFIVIIVVFTFVL